MEILQRACKKGVAAGIKMLKRVHSHMKVRKPAFLEVGGLSQVSSEACPNYAFGAIFSMPQKSCTKNYLPGCSHKLSGSVESQL